MTLINLDFLLHFNLQLFPFSIWILQGNILKWKEIVLWLLPWRWASRVVKKCSEKKMVRGCGSILKFFCLYGIKMNRVIFYSRDDDSNFSFLKLHVITLEVATILMMHLFHKFCTAMSPPPPSHPLRTTYTLLQPSYLHLLPSGSWWLVECQEFAAYQYFKGTAEIKALIFM